MVDPEVQRWVRFDTLLNGDVCDCVAYIYRLDPRGHAVKPYWLKRSADPNLVRQIQSAGGGKFWVIIRRGRTMVFSGRLAFAPLPKHMLST